MNEDDFRTTKGFKGYVSKPEITELSPDFLVKRSKNVLIDYASRVVSRSGYTLYRQANTGGSGIKSSYDWGTSNGKQFMIRVYDDQIEFDWNGAFNVLKTGLTSSAIEFAKVWDNTEKIDVLLFVLGESNTYKWSGAVSTVWKSTATTLTKQGVLTAQNTIAFNAGTPGSIAPTVTDSLANFVNAGFLPGDTLYVTGSAGNSRNFTIGSVTAGVLTLIMSDIVVTEAAGPAVTLHTGEPTWATSRFLTTGTRKISYLGVEYAYTGGENTDTLTGLVGFPVVAVGDPVWQTVITLANPGSININFKQDYIAVQLNQVVLESSKSQEVYISSATDYTDFTLTSPRAPADPAKVVMDNFPACSPVPMDNSAQTASSLMLPAGRSEFFQLDYKLSQDQTNELVRVIKLKTASGSGVISRGAIGSIKNAVAYISREPALDTLGDIESVDGKTNVPLSDLVKDDFDTYDFTGTHLKYWKRAIYISLPAHGLVLIYDLMRHLWQPPQTIPVGRFSILNDELYGHSSIRNETYKLFTGTDDNGIFIPHVARFAYNNGGRRDRVKNMSTYWSDGYINRSGILKMKAFLGFDGVAGIKEMTIAGNDTAITNPVDASPIGSEPLGEVPLGGASLGESNGLNNMLRFWQEDSMSAVDYVEHFIEYSMSVKGGQFAIVAHGSNQWDAGTSPVSHKK